jgi:hypothetical protein
VQVLEDVEEAVDEERVVLDELVVLGDLAGARRQSCASMAFPKGGAAIASCARAPALNPSGFPHQRESSSPPGELVGAWRARRRLRRSHIAWGTSLSG